MNTARKILFLIALTTLLLGLSATMVAAATPPQPTYGAAVIDGVTGEWSLANDFFADMYRAFNPKQKLESKLYLRYDCAKKVLNALVLAEPGVGVLQQPGDAWIKLASSAGNLVDGNAGNNGIAPDFAWVYEGGTLRGYEASAPLAEGNYRFSAHIEVNDNGAQTSGTDRKTDPAGIALEISCPVGVPSITIKKYTNGADADQVPGPYIFAGSPVNWTYQVTNSGTASLSNVQVTDSKGVSVNCSGKTTLAVGEPMTCTASGFADPGQYENIGTASGEFSGATVTATDPSHYFGATPGISITKYTNDEDANFEPGPFIPVGSTVTWRYVVRNSGNVPFTNVVVTDSKRVTVNCFSRTTLDVNETMTCLATGTAIEGQYENTGQVEGTPPGGLAKQFASDPSHYFGVVPSVDIEKFVSVDNQATWVDADAPTGPSVPVGTNVYFKFFVTNTGNVPLSNVTVSDSVYNTGTCPAVPSPLAAGATYPCIIGPIAATAGQHTNTGTVTGGYNGVTVNDDDPANYFGANPAIDLTKYVSVDNKASWADANATTGPIAFVGAPVYFKFVVRNTGNVTLGTLKLTDNVYSTTSCSVPTALDPGASFECIIGSFSATAGQHTNTGTASGVYGIKTVTDTDSANYFGAAPSVDIEKFVSVDAKATWADANATTGPIAFVGAPVYFKFVVKNTGNVALSNLTLTDNVYNTSACSVQATLVAGASYECVIGPLSATAGQHTNTGTVTGGYNGGTYSDKDDANYFGANPAIVLTKYVSVGNTTSWDDANATTGPIAFVGDQVYFKFVGKNTGNVSLSNVTLRDSVYSITSCSIPATLALDASFECVIGPFAATKDQHTNTGTTSGVYGAKTVSDTDPANYFGAAPSVDIEKFVSVDNQATWADADTPPGPNARVASNVYFKFVVRNTGNVPLSSVTVSDSDYSTSTCSVQATLAAGATYQCIIGPFAATAGQHTNTGTVNAVYSGRTYSDKDDANYNGFYPYGKIAPTQTTCQDFVNGTAADLNELFYGVKGNKILNVAPGVLFYYTKFTAQSANPTVVIEQTNSNNRVPFFGVQQNNQVSLYNADCSNSSLGKVIVTKGQVYVAMTGATIGRDYVIGVKYDPSTVVGTNVPNPTTVHYDFKTKIGVSIVDMDMNGLNLVKK